MRVFMILAALVAGFSSVAFALMAAVAFSDAQYRCPGQQCDDARGAGFIYAGLSLAVLIALVCCYLAVRRRRGAAGPQSKA